MADSGTLIHAVLAAMLAGAGTAAAQGPADPVAGAIARSRAILADAVRRGDAPGLAAAVAIGERIVWAEGFGHADLERGIPATATTVFGIGSISKTLTLAGALALVDAGRLDLDAPVERYLADFPHRDRGVTLRRIAVHQSGLADEFASRHYSDTTRFADLEAAYREIRRERLVYPPGTRTEYATGLFTIVGRAMERAEGTPYEELMKRRVFAVAGMTATRPNDPRQPPPRRTAFHLRSDGGAFREAPPFDPSHKLPGAGFLSTAPDLARFGAALLGSGLISEAARREMFAPVPLADGTPTRFALGFQVVRENGRRVLIQPGGGIGIAGWLVLYPDDDLVVALLSNVTGAPLENERRAVGEAFLPAR